MIEFIYIQCLKIVTFERVNTAYCISRLIGLLQREANIVNLQKQRLVLTKSAFLVTFERILSDIHPFDSVEVQIIN